jgi:hypothetical protein
LSAPLETCFPVLFRFCFSPSIISSLQCATLK